MINEHLEVIIRDKFSKGESREEISYELQNQGWDIGDINMTIRHIQHDAIKQLPGISHIVQRFELWEEKAASASNKVVIGVLVASLLSVLVIAIGLFILFDPLSIKAEERDTQRESDFITIRTAVDKYYQDKKAYPKRLNDLIPKYIGALPRDPRTGNAYGYTLKQGNNYELCVYFELKTTQCLATGTTENPIPQVNTNNLPQTSHNQ